MTIYAPGASDDKCHLTPPTVATVSAVVLPSTAARDDSPCSGKHTIVTTNRPREDWARLLGDTVVVTPLLDRLMHHGHHRKFEGKSWRLKEAAARIAKRPAAT